jgi:hypothetical protein
MGEVEGVPSWPPQTYPRPFGMSLRDGMNVRLRGGIQNPAAR